MLAEIKLNSLIQPIKHPVLLLKDGKLTTLEDLFKGVRVLVDVPTQVILFDPERTIQAELKTTGAELSRELLEKPPEKRPVIKKSKTEIEQEILEAWHYGDNSIEEIAQITGYSIKTIKFYIPENEKG